MKYILIIVIICAIMVAFLLLRKKARPPVDVYVCSECGLKNCSCHKENRQDPGNR